MRFVSSLRSFPLRFVLTIVYQWMYFIVGLALFMPENAFFWTCITLFATCSVMMLFAVIYPGMGRRMSPYVTNLLLPINLATSWGLYSKRVLHRNYCESILSN